MTDATQAPMPKTKDLFGWYDSAAHHVPTYDPPHDAECPYCGLPMTPADIQIHHMAAPSVQARSYFHRTHRTCYGRAGDSVRRAMFSAVRARISHDGEAV